MRLKVLAGVVPAWLAFSSLALAETTAPPPAASTQASAPTSTGYKGSMRNIGSADNLLSGFAILGYRYSHSSAFGLGARFQKTIISDVVFKDHEKIKDDFGIEFGVDYLHYSFDYLGFDWDFDEISLMAGGVWNVWLNDNLAVYPKLELGYSFGSGGTDIAGVHYSEDDGFVAQAAAGVLYKAFPVVLRAELGTWSLRLGAGFQF